VLVDCDDSGIGWIWELYNYAIVSMQISAHYCPPHNLTSGTRTAAWSGVVHEIAVLNDCKVQHQNSKEDRNKQQT